MDKHGPDHLPAAQECRCPCPGASEIRNIAGLFFWLCIVSLGIVLSSGLIRYIYYKPENDGSEQVKKGLLIFKHVLFAVIFAGGTFLAYRWTFQ